MLPYIYTSFLRATETGEPVQRPLIFDYQQDAAVRDLDDQYLFGPDLLVAPVIEPGTTARPVYLPAGEWYEWHGDNSGEDERIAGGSFVVASTPLDRIPLYARAGAVMPMWPEAPASTSGYHPELIELHVFVPGSDLSCESRLVEDDGLTIDDDGSRCLRTAITMARAKDRVRISGRVQGAGYPEFSRADFRLVLHGAEAQDVLVDGQPVESDGRSVTFGNDGTDFDVAFTV